jgi:hypothetical protein
MDKQNNIDKPRVYRIRVNGQLNQHWTDWFGGFTLEYFNGDTVLTGLVADQAALHGVLSKIRDLGLPIELVQHMEIKESTLTS